MAVVSGPGLLVPARDSTTFRNTVAHVTSRATESHDGARPTVHFVYPLSRRATGEGSTEEAREFLERIEVWVEEDLGEVDEDIAVETGIVGQSEYLFNPGDYAAALARYADEHGLETVVLDPEFNPVGTTPLLPPLERELDRAGLAVETAPVERTTRRGPLRRRAGIGQFVVLFGWTFGFYLLVGGSLSAFDLVTGAVSGLVVTALLWRVSLRGTAEPRRTVGRFARLALYVPVLLWMIVKANVEIAAVVLHPDLPIDPEEVEFDAAVWSELAVATLANSITLTPGTLTVDVTQRRFTVHTLTAGARADLLDGALERGVRAVFYGRSAASIQTPTERGAVGGTDAENAVGKTEGAVEATEGAAEEIETEGRGQA